MNSFAAFVAPLALLLPAGVADAPERSDVGAGGFMSFVPDNIGPAAPLSVASGDAPARLPLSEAVLPGDQSQVRIEQSITIRITPRRNASQADLLAQLPQGRTATRIEERKMGACVPAQGIVGVQTGEDNTLILFMRDRRIISVALEKACSARDFYSGFLLERTSDGQLCVKRDKIHSRAGAKCELKQFRQLVAVRD